MWSKGWASEVQFGGWRVIGEARPVASWRSKRGLGKANVVVGVSLG